MAPRARPASRLYRAALGCMAAVAWAVASAGDFSAAPVRIFMGAATRGTAITVTNEADAELLMHAEAFRWTQKPDGEDELAPTDDLMLSPPVLKLAPHSTQVVRLVRLAPPPAGAELAYRLFLREVPSPRADEGQTVKFALTFSLPVFITPAGARRRLACTVGRGAPDRLLATCRNGGNAYAQVRQLALHGPGAEPLAVADRSAYVLPGVSRTFEFARAPAPVPAGRYRLQAVFDDGGRESFDVVLAEGQ